MNKRKLAALIAAAFAGLMLSSPSFAADADKAPATSGSSMSPPATSGTSMSPPATGRSRGASESSSTEGAEERGAASKEVVAAANANYKSAVEKCDAQPTGQRSSCMEDAKTAQSLAMSNGRNGPPATK